MAISQTKALIEAEREVVASLVQHGLPFASACAVAGNGAQESGCQPIAPSQDGSDGFLQWRDAPLSGAHRLSDMKKWCADRKMDWRTIDAQCQFFIWECKSYYQTLWADLVSATKPLATLTANIMVFYERPAAAYAALDNRIEAAQYCFENFKDITSLPVPVTPTPSVTDALQAAIDDLNAKKAALEVAKANLEKQIAALEDELKKAQEALG